MKKILEISKTHRAKWTTQVISASQQGRQQPQQKNGQKISIGNLYEETWITARDMKRSYTSDH